MINEERLIDLVRGNEILYNKASMGYRLPQKKLEAWAAISRELGTTEEQCTKRWISLRERYTRELRRLDAPSGSAAASQQMWPYFENLNFLKAFIAPRPTRCTRNVLETSYISLPSERSPSSPILFSLDEDEGPIQKWSGDPVTSTPSVTKKKKVAGSGQRRRLQGSLPALQGSAEGAIGGEQDSKVIWRHDCVIHRRDEPKKAGKGHTNHN